MKLFVPEPLATEIVTLRQQVSALEAQLAECQWRPITPEDLPKVGEHELLRKRLGTPRGTWIVCDVADAPFEHPATAAQYSNLGWTHFRAINPPQQGAK